MQEHSTHAGQLYNDHKHCGQQCRRSIDPKPGFVFSEETQIQREDVHCWSLHRKGLLHADGIETERTINVLPAVVSSGVGQRYS